MVGWVLLACCVPSAIARALNLDNAAIPILLAALVPLALLPAFPVLLGALLARRWVMAGAAAILVVAYLAWMWPALPRPRPTPAVAQGGIHLKVLTFNAYVGQADAAALGRLIQREQPDIVAIEELTPEFEQRLVATSALSGLTYTVVRPSEDPLMGAGLWSRFGFSAGGVLDAPGSRMPWADVETGNQLVRVQVAHPVAPVASISEWRAGLSALAQVARRKRQPLVMLGDFNATRSQRGFRAILGRSLVDASEARGKFLFRTWPSGGRLPEPVLALDHVVVSTHLRVVEAHLELSVGSDHLPVIATVALGRARAANG